MTGRLIPALGFALLCGLTGLSAALAYALPVAPLAGLALLIGLIPLWLPRQRPAASGARLAEWVSLVLLAFIGLGVSATTLLHLLRGDLPQVHTAAPLFLFTIALYGVYLILYHQRESARTATAPEHLGAIFSGPPILLTMIMGLILATYTLMAMDYAQDANPVLTYFTDKFLKRGIIPPLTLVLFYWGLLLLATKAGVLWREKRLMQDADAEAILERAYRQGMADGGAGALNSFLDMLWKKSSDSYTFPRYISWAVPILGFIGTVLGISLVADGIQEIFGSQESIAQVSGQLGEAIAPLGIAFDTTLIALSLSVFLVLLQTALHRWEDNLLVDYENRLRNPQRDAGRADAGSSD